MSSVIHLVRHAHVHNPNGDWYGSDLTASLSARGIIQAKYLGSYLNKSPISQVFTSPYERARQTAQVIAQALDCRVVVDERLAEAQTWHARYSILPPEAAEPPTGDSRESVAQVFARMLSFVEMIIASSRAEETVAVSHATPIYLTRVGLSSGLTQSASALMISQASERLALRPPKLASITTLLRGVNAYEFEYKHVGKGIAKHLESELGGPPR